MKISFSVLMLSVLFLSGCGGVKSRIRENERQFDSYPPEAQAQIQNGRIDRGFTEDMVYMALGKPSDKTTSTRNGKQVTVWKYTRSVPSSPPGQAGANLSAPYGYPGFGPGPSQPTPMFYERGSDKVEFENGHVVRWDPSLQP